MEEELRKKSEQDNEQGEYGREERGAALAEGRAAGRRGEMARKHEPVPRMTHPIFTSELVRLQSPLAEKAISQLDPQVPRR